jgi:hypothetical protein
MTCRNIRLVSKSAEKEEVMKSGVTKSILTILAVAFTGSLFAQLDPAQRKAEIPFSFYVQDKVLPPGTYLVGWIGGRLNVRSFDGKQGAAVLAIPVQSKRTPERSVLEFSRYGDVLYLSKVWIAGRDSGHELLQTHAEMELAQKTRIKAFAMVRLAATH